MAPGISKNKEPPERRPLNRELYELHALDNQCLGIYTSDREVKFHDPELVVNFRSDYINQPIVHREVPPPGRIVPPIDIDLECKKKQLSHYPQDFHKIVNLVIKQIMKKIYFENDCLRMFLFHSRTRSLKRDKKPKIEVNSASFKKLLLIVKAMKMYETEKLETDGFSKRMNKFITKKIMDIRENKMKFRMVCKISTVIKVKKNLFLLFNEYETKKLCLEKAWSIHNNVITGRINWAATFLTNTTNHFNINEESAPNPTKFYWHLVKMVRHLRNQELLTSGAESQNDSKKLKDWKNIIDRLVAFRDNVKGRPVEYYRDLYTLFSLTDSQRKKLALEFEGLIPYISFFDAKAHFLRREIKAMDEFREQATEAAKAIPRRHSN